MHVLYEVTVKVTHVFFWVLWLSPVIVIAHLLCTHLHQPSALARRTDNWIK